MGNISEKELPFSLIFRSFLGSTGKSNGLSNKKLSDLRSEELIIRDAIRRIEKFYTGTSKKCQSFIEFLSTSSGNKSNKSCIPCSHRIYQESLNESMKFHMKFSSNRKNFGRNALKKSNRLINDLTKLFLERNQKTGLKIKLKSQSELAAIFRNLFKRFCDLISGHLVSQIDTLKQKMEFWSMTMNSRRNFETLIVENNEISDFRKICRELAHFFLKKENLQNCQGVKNILKQCQTLILRSALQIESVSKKHSMRKSKNETDFLTNFSEIFEKTVWSNTRHCIGQGSITFLRKISVCKKHDIDHIVEYVRNLLEFLSFSQEFREITWFSSKKIDQKIKRFQESQSSTKFNTKNRNKRSSFSETEEVRLESCTLLHHTRIIVRRKIKLLTTLRGGERLISNRSISGNYTMHRLIFLGERTIYQSKYCCLQTKLNENNSYFLGVITKWQRQKLTLNLCLRSMSTPNWRHRLMFQNHPCWTFVTSTRESLDGLKVRYLITFTKMSPREHATRGKLPFFAKTKASLTGLTSLKPIILTRLSSVKKQETLTAIYAGSKVQINEMEYSS